MCGEVRVDRWVWLRDKVRVDRQQVWVCERMEMGVAR